MQRFATLTVLLMLSIGCFSQSGSSTTTTTKTCDERDLKLREALGSSSAVIVYNTYLAIGSICDNYVYKGYDEKKVNELFDEQKELLGTIDNVFNKLLDEKILVKKDDVAYTQELSSVLKGLKRQMELFQEYMKDKTDARTTTYDNQRKKNWDKIARLIGIN